MTLSAAPKYFEPLPCTRASHRQDIVTGDWWRLDGYGLDLRAALIRAGGYDGSLLENLERVRTVLQQGAGTSAHDLSFSASAGPAPSVQRSQAYDEFAFPGRWLVGGLLPGCHDRVVGMGVLAVAAGVAVAVRSGVAESGKGSKVFPLRQHRAPLWFRSARSPRAT